jgi:hypothetical protein
MMEKFAEALTLLWRHLWLFGAIILTVWLPGNILLGFISYYIAESTDTGFIGLIKVTAWIEGIFGPIYIGALIYALSRIKSGQTVTYKQAIAVGFKKWGSLFAARFIAGICIVLGLLALIIPGIIMTVRYSLLDEVIILEEDRVTTNPRSRSTDLTVGRRWQIFWAGILFYVIFAVASFVLYLPLAFIDSFKLMPLEVVLDCILDIAFAVIQIVIFLFYWESTQEQRCSGLSSASNGGPQIPTNDSGIAEEKAQ